MSKPNVNRTASRPKLRAVEPDADAEAMGAASAAVRAYLKTSHGQIHMRTAVEREGLWRLMMVRYDAKDDAEACRRIAAIIGVLRFSDDALAECAFEHEICAAVDEGDQS